MAYWLGTVQSLTSSLAGGFRKRDPEIVVNNVFFELVVVAFEARCSNYRITVVLVAFSAFSFSLFSSITCPACIFNCSIFDSSVLFKHRAADQK